MDKKITAVKKYNDDIGSDNMSNTEYITREKAINAFKDIQKIHSKPGQDFFVWTQFLSDQIGSDGTRGMMYIIGTFSQHDEAENVAKNIIEKIGIRSVFVGKTCKWIPIDDNIKNKKISYVDPDKDKKLKDAHHEEINRLKERLEREERIRNQIEEDEKNSENDDTIEYYTKQSYLKIKNEVDIENLEKLIAEKRKTISEIEEHILEAYTKHPEYEENWLKVLEPKLKERGETHVFENLFSRNEKSKEFLKIKSEKEK